MIRSTVYPGVTESLAKYAESKGKRLRLAFCPERIVEGHAIEELQTLPQIVSGTTADAEEDAARLFGLSLPKSCDWLRSKRSWSRSSATPIATSSLPSPISST